ncbi:hypothetical protein ACFLZH_02235 [Patescibacteria group bacterium]
METPRLNNTEYPKDMLGLKLAITNIIAIASIAVTLVIHDRMMKPQAEDSTNNRPKVCQTNIKYPVIAASLPEYLP